MPDAEHQSISHWIALLKTGNADAAQELWQRYSEELIRLARRRLKNARRAVADEEDAALSAFDSFCRGAATGRYPRLDDRHDLWRLLLVITERKAFDQSKREQRKKRGGGKMVALADDSQDGLGFDGLPALTPTPEFAAMVAEQCRNLFEILGNDSLKEIARLRMEGFTSAEVAEQLGCSVRSVTRKLELIRRAWLGDEDTE
jgi:DNA-directed RNA polymerase specialized sigma24 family protein